MNDRRFGRLRFLVVLWQEYVLSARERYLLILLGCVVIVAIVWRRHFHV